jgi:uncharacterized protein
MTNSPDYTLGDPQRPYLEGCARGEFVFLRCRACCDAQLPAYRICRRCGGREFTDEVASGGGRVASFTIVHRAASEHFRPLVPFALGLIDLDEGFRAMMRIEGMGEPAIGARVRIAFADDGPDGASLPHAVLAEGS